MHVDPAGGEGSTCVIPGESHLDAARLPRFGRPRDVGMEVSRGRSRAKFLGYTFAEKTGRTLVHPKSFKRLKDKLRAVFCRARGGSLLRTNGELNAILCGWRQYFRLDNREGVFEALDIHIRRHLRKLVWIAWKRPRTRERELRRRGLDGFRAWESANNGRGAWWNANARHMRDAFPLSFFKRHGLYSLLAMR